MSQKIIPFIWADSRIDEMGAFYAASIPRTTTTVAGAYPDHIPGLGGQTLTLDVSIDGFSLMLLNGGSTQTPTPAISFFLNFDPLMFGGDTDAARESLNATWAALSADGMARMPLQEYEWSPLYGWVQDRYGVSWQLMLTNPEGEPRPFVVPQLMFGGPVVNRAREAAEFYTSLFEGGSVGFIAPFGEQTGPAAADSVMFGEFHVAGQTFSMMDSGREQDFTFSTAVSLQVQCADQAEIDRLWSALSAVPDAEVCGWCVDRFGVSWQVVPDNAAELLKRPGAMENMMKMKKLIIADY